MNLELNCCKEMFWTFKATCGFTRSCRNKAVYGLPARLNFFWHVSYVSRPRCYSSLNSYINTACHQWISTPSFSSSVVLSYIGWSNVTVICGNIVISVLSGNTAYCVWKIFAVAYPRGYKGIYTAKLPCTVPQRDRTASVPVTSSEPGK